jgi:hypothetical protein
MKLFFGILWLNETPERNKNGWSDRILKIFEIYTKYYNSITRFIDVTSEIMTKFDLMTHYYFW